MVTGLNFLSCCRASAGQDTWEATGEADVGSGSARKISTKKWVQDRVPYMIQELREPTHTGLKLEF